jgi:hypothetical protein
LAEDFQLLENIPATGEQHQQERNKTCNKKTQKHLSGWFFVSTDTQWQFIEKF